MERPEVANEWRLTSVGAGGAAVSVSKTAVAGQLHVFTKLIFSINGAPTANARLLFNDGIGANTLFAYLPAGAGTLIFDFGVEGWPATGENVTHTFTSDAVGGTVVASLLALGYTIGA